MIYIQKNKNLDFSFEQYKKFKNIINKTIKEISNVKNQKYENGIEDIFKIEEKKELLLEYLFFVNYKKLLNINFDYNIHNNNKTFIEQLKKFKLYTNISFFNRKLFKSIFNIFLYLIINIEKEIKIISTNDDKNDDKDFCIENEIKNINKYYYFLYEIYLLIIKAYIKKIYNFKYLLFFFRYFMFFY